MAGRDDMGSEARSAELYRQPDRKNDPPEVKPKPDVPQKPPKRPSKRSEGTSNVVDSQINDLSAAGNEEQTPLRQEPSPEPQEPRKATPQPTTFPDLTPRTSKTTDTKQANKEASHSTRQDRISSSCLTNPQNLSLPKSEEGYIHVKMGGDATEYSETSTSSSDEDDQEEEVNASIADGVKHIHIHININLIPKAKQKRQRKVKDRQYSYTRSVEIKRNRYQHLKPLKANDHDGAVERQQQCDMEPPPVPPKLPAKTYKKRSSLKTGDTDNDYLIATDKDISEDGDDWGYERYATNEHPKRKSKWNRDYDEITIDLDQPVENNEPPENPAAGEAISEERSIYAQVKPQTENTETSCPWLFHHKSRIQAEDQLKTDQNGSFVVIEEDHKSMPFTPYTFLIVHGGQLKKIPVLKHTRRGKVRYTLANSELKQKSIDDIVWFYQRRTIPGLDIWLKPPG